MVEEVGQSAFRRLTHGSRSSFTGLNMLRKETRIPTPHFLPLANHHNHCGTSLSTTSSAPDCADPAVAAHRPHNSGSIGETDAHIASYAGGSSMSEPVDLTAEELAIY